MSLWQITLADLRSRYRSYAFLVTVIVSLYLGYLFVPPVGESFYFTLTLGDYRGIYNSAWVGTVFAMSGIMFIGLFGFYIIKNAVGRDIKTQVGELLASTQLSSIGYLWAKFFSNVIFMLMMVAPFLAMAPVMQLLRGEVAEINVVQMYSPLIVIILPAIVFVSGLALFFEVTPLLRGGLGNIIYYFAYFGSMIAIVESGSVYDLLGIAFVEAELKKVAFEMIPGYTAGFSIGHMGRPMPEGAFLWSGLQWTSEFLISRVTWLIGGLFCVAVSAPFFNRFDTSKGALKKKNTAGSQRLSSNKLLNIILKPVEILAGGSSFGRLLTAETRLSLAGLNIYWYLGAVGLFIASVLTPLEAARQYILPFLWIWPILIWSQASVRERHYGVDQIMNASTHSPTTRALAIWLSSLFVALLLGAGYFVRLVIAADFQTLQAALIGALFIASLSLASGVISKTARVFEIVYLIFWYIGPLNHGYELDFMGTFEQTVTSGYPMIYLGISIALLLVALGIRAGKAKA